VTKAARCEQPQHEDFDADLPARHGPVVARQVANCTSPLRRRLPTPIAGQTATHPRGARCACAGYSRAGWPASRDDSAPATSAPRARPSSTAQSEHTAVSRPPRPQCTLVRDAAVVIAPPAQAGLGRSTSRQCRPQERVVRHLPGRPDRPAPRALPVRRPPCDGSGCRAAGGRTAASPSRIGGCPAGLRLARRHSPPTTGSRCRRRARPPTRVERGARERGAPLAGCATSRANSAPATSAPGARTSSAMHSEHTAVSRPSWAERTRVRDAAVVMAWASRGSPTAEYLAAVSPSGARRTASARAARSACATCAAGAASTVRRIRLSGSRWPYRCSKVESSVSGRSSMRASAWSG
jgi:hypothetical protein